MQASLQDQAVIIQNILLSMMVTLNLELVRDQGFMMSGELSLCQDQMFTDKMQATFRSLLLNLALEAQSRDLTLQKVP